MRLERIKALRWQGRSLPEDVKSSMSTAELQVSLHPAQAMPHCKAACTCEHDNNNNIVIRRIITITMLSGS